MEVIVLCFDHPRIFELCCLIQKFIILLYILILFTVAVGVTSLTTLAVWWGCKVDHGY